MTRIGMVMMIYRVKKGTRGEQHGAMYKKRCDIDGGIDRR